MDEDATKELTDLVTEYVNLDDTIKDTLAEIKRKNDNYKKDLDIAKERKAEIEEALVDYLKKRAEEDPNFVPIITINGGKLELKETVKKAVMKKDNVEECLLKKYGVEETNLIMDMIDESLDVTYTDKLSRRKNPKKKNS